MYKYTFAEKYRKSVKFYPGTNYIRSESITTMVEHHNWPSDYEAKYRVLHLLVNGFTFCSKKRLTHVYVNGYPVPVQFFDETTLP